MADTAAPAGSSPPANVAPVPGVLTPETHTAIDKGIRAMQEMLPMLDAAQACNCNVSEKRALREQMYATLQAFKKFFPLTAQQMTTYE
jgi:hypothetical protein